MEKIKILWTIVMIVVTFANILAIIRIFKKK